MGHTYTTLMYHGVFSTKERREILRPDILPQLIKVAGGIIRDRDGKLLAMNGTRNHVHLLAILHPKHAVSDMFGDIKAISSGWVHDTFPELRDFAWQSGYSAFSVSRSVAPKVEAYIAGQQEHHRKQTFEEELIALLKRHGIEYDPRYVFD
jgi:REP element-mobilizing transposase RayT